MAYCFRIRFELSQRTRIHSDQGELQIPDPVEGKKVHLKAGQQMASISEARSLLLRGQPFDTEADAQAAAGRWVAILKKSLARAYIGADFGERAPAGAMTEYGLDHFSKQADGARLLNDTHGVSVFDCEPPPKFIRVGLGEITVGADVDRLLAAIDIANELDVQMPAREHLAYDLFSASFSESSEDARFMMLMMAVETLIDPAPRPDAVRTHVETLIEATRKSDLPKDQIKSIVGSLRWLLDESIGQAGRKLAERLGDRTYMEEPEDPVRFFSKCYTLRSALAHGAEPRPSRGDVGGRAASLEHFVADLLTLEFADRP